MIPIQINGKTVFLSFQEWISMTDEDYQNLVAKDNGYDIENPFDKLLDHIDDSKENYLKDIPDLTEIPKLTDEDIEKIDKNDD